MTFAFSPYPDVRNIGLRIEEIRTQLNVAGWDTTALDTALKALRDDNGGVPLPDGVTELAAVMRAVFELRPQVMQQAHSLYEVEYKKLAVTEPAAPPQTVTVQFTQPSEFFDNGFQNGNQNIPVSIITSDALPLAVGVSVDVRDLLSGSAPTPGGYTMATPQSLSWIPGDASGTVKNAIINIAPGGALGTVDIDLDSAVGATEGGQNTYTVNIGGGGA